MKVTLKKEFTAIYFGGCEDCKYITELSNFNGTLVAWNSNTCTGGTIRGGATFGKGDWVVFDETGPIEVVPDEWFHEKYTSVSNVTHIEMPMTAEEQDAQDTQG